MAKTKFELRKYASSQHTACYDAHEVVSTHASVDVAFRKLEKLSAKFTELCKVVAVTPFGESTVFDDELWKWGSKEQRQPWHMR